MNVRCFEPPWTGLLRPLLMGVLNITPDSFSDGGDFIDPDSAVEQARRMIGEGADVLDIGGESSRPGAQPVTVSEQLKRIIPVIRKIRGFSDIPISVDTTKREIFERALDEGAGILNDISAMEADKTMMPFVIEKNAPVILMHKQGVPADMQENPQYIHVVDEVIEYLGKRIEAFLKAGGNKDRIAIDPGLGFGKTFNHNMEIIHHIDQLNKLGVPTLVGLSRKSFVGELQQEENPKKRLEGTLALSAYCFQKGIRFFRVHDVAPHRKLLDTLFRI